MSNQRKYRKARKAMDREMDAFSASWSGQTPEAETRFQSGKRVSKKKR